MKHNFKVGDIVKVTNPNKCYDVYKTMFELMDFVDISVNNPHAKGTVVQIFDIRSHDFLKETVYGVRDVYGKEALYSIDGFEAVSFESRKPKYKEVVINGVYTAEIYSDKILVGCQTIYKDTFDAIVRTAKEMGFYDFK